MANKKILVMLDPGHGGNDPGAIGNGLREADAVLMLVLYEAELWRSIGAEVVLTRDSDKTVSLSNRTMLENQRKPNCFISHHMDAAPLRADGAQSTEACGATVWLHSKAPDSYVKWAERMQQEISKEGLSSNRAADIQKGHRSGANYNYAVNGNTLGASMLLELGFISSPQNVEEFRGKYKEYAKAIVRSTCSFLGWDCSALDNAQPPADNTAKLQQRIEELEDKLAQERSRTQHLEQRIQNAIKDLSA